MRPPRETAGQEIPRLPAVLQLARTRVGQGSGRWQQVEDLYDSALGLEPGQRAAFGQAPDFLDVPALEVMAALAWYALQNVPPTLSPLRSRRRPNLPRYRDNEQPPRKW